MVSIKLIIKAPNQRLDDQTIDCDIDWTVHRLKSHLSSVYPTKPRIEDQRLIYSGHLLKNEQSLCDVLQPIDDNLTFTIHLVCAQRSLDSPKRNNNNMAANNGSERLSNSNERPEPQTSDNNATNNNANGISFNPLNPTPNLVQPFLQMDVTDTAPVIVTPEQMFQHMALFQQAYAQYMTQYFGQNPYANNQLGTQTVLNNPTVPITVPPNAAPIAPTPPIPQVNAAQVQPQQPQVQRLNAGPGGGPADDDEDPNNRDWLDWFYWMSRAVVLFSIIYFYSSFNRFLLVVVLAVMLYLYQTNWFNRRPPNNNNNNNLNVAPIVANNNNNENNTDIRENIREDDDLNDGVEGEETEILERRRLRVNTNAVSSDPRSTEQRFTGLRFFWVIVSSLFSSLIPENPAVPVNLN